MHVDPRLHFLLRRLKEAQYDYFPNEKIRILDVGCADGSFTKLLSDNIYNFGTIDGVDVPSQWTRENQAKSTTNIYMQDLQAGTGRIPMEHYHIITLWEVLEHIENVYSFLRNIRKTLAPDGVILLSSPNLFSLSRLLKGQQWVGIAEQDHKYLFDKLLLKMILSRGGFSSVKVRAYYFPSLGPSLDRFNKLLASLPGGGMLFAQALKQ